MIGMEFAIKESVEMSSTRPSVNINVIKADLRRTDANALDYANSRFGDLEAMFLAARFFINKSIAIVNLQNNHIGDDGIRMLAESLKEQPTVRQVNLAGNPFGDVGVLALADLKTERPDIEICGVDLSNEVLLQARGRNHIQSLKNGNCAGPHYTDGNVPIESHWTMNARKSHGVTVPRR